MSFKHLKVYIEQQLLEAGSGYFKELLPPHLNDIVVLVGTYTTGAEAFLDKEYPNLPQAEKNSILRVLVRDLVERVDKPVGSRVADSKLFNREDEKFYRFHFEPGYLAFLQLVEKGKLADIDPEKLLEELKDLKEDQIIKEEEKSRIATNAYAYWQLIIGYVPDVLSYSLSITTKVIKTVARQLKPAVTASKNLSTLGSVISAAGFSLDLVTNVGAFFVDWVKTGSLKKAAKIPRIARIALAGTILTLIIVGLATGFGSYLSLPMCAILISAATIRLGYYAFDRIRTKRKLKKVEAALAYQNRIIDEEIKLIRDENTGKFEHVKGISGEIDYWANQLNNELEADNDPKKIERYKKELLRLKPKITLAKNTKKRLETEKAELTKHNNDLKDGQVYKVLQMTAIIGISTLALAGAIVFLFNPYVGGIILGVAAGLGLTNIFVAITYKVVKGIMRRRAKKKAANKKLLEEQEDNTLTPELEVGMNNAPPRTGRIFARMRRLGRRSRPEYVSESDEAKDVLTSEEKDKTTTLSSTPKSTPGHSEKYIYKQMNPNPGQAREKAKGAVDEMHRNTKLVEALKEALNSGKTENVFTAVEKLLETRDDFFVKDVLDVEHEVKKLIIDTFASLTESGAASHEIVIAAVKQSKPMLDAMQAGGVKLFIEGDSGNAGEGSSTTEEKDTEKTEENIFKKS